MTLFLDRLISAYLMNGYIVTRRLARWRHVCVRTSSAEREHPASEASAGGIAIRYYYAYTADRSRTRSQKIHSTRAQAQRYIRPQLQFGQLRHLVVIETPMCVEVNFNFSNNISQK